MFFNLQMFFKGLDDNRAVPPADALNASVPNTAMPLLPMPPPPTRKGLHLPLPESPSEVAKAPDFVEVETLLVSQTLTLPSLSLPSAGRLAHFSHA